MAALETKVGATEEHMKYIFTLAFTHNLSIPTPGEVISNLAIKTHPVEQAVVNVADYLVGEKKQAEAIVLVKQAIEHADVKQEAKGFLYKW